MKALEGIWLDRKSETTLQDQVAQQIRELVRRGTLRPHINDPAILIQTLQAGQWRRIVTKFRILVVFNYPGLIPCGKIQDGETTLKRESDSGRKLPRGRSVDQSQVFRIVGRHLEALLVELAGDDFRSCAAPGQARAKIARVLHVDPRSVAGHQQISQQIEGLLRSARDDDRLPVAPEFLI